MKKCTAPKRGAHFSKVSAAPQRGAHLITMCGRGHAKWTFFVLKVRGPRTAPRPKKVKTSVLCESGAQKSNFGNEDRA